MTASTPKPDPPETRRRVTLGGETFVLRADTDGDTLDQVIRAVDEAYRARLRQLGSEEKIRAALLAALQFAGDLHETRRRVETLSAKSDRLAPSLDRIHRLLKQNP